MDELQVLRLQFAEGNYYATSNLGWSPLSLWPCRAPLTLGVEFLSF